MLTATERVQVVDYFAMAIQSDLNPRQTIKLIFAVGASPPLTELPYLPAPRDYAGWVLDYCLGQRWPQPPATSMMESLLAWLVNTKLIGALAAQLARVKAGVDPNPDPYDSRWLLNGFPFFDRDKLRPIVRDFLERPNRQVLCVKGDSGSGRSYTAEYFDWLRDKVPGLRVVYEEVADGAAATYTVSTLVRKLTAPMSFQESVPEDNSNSSFGAELCRWFTPIAMRQSGRWVFVLDGFGQQDIQAPVKEFISCLANVLRRGEERQRLRLALLGCELTDPQQLRITYVESLPPPCNITRQHLVDCLVDLNVNRSSEGKQPISDIGTVADGILASVPANGKDRLTSLNDQLSALWNWEGPPVQAVPQAPPALSMQGAAQVTVP